jgi:hypothetical protein
MIGPNYLAETDSPYPHHCNRIILLFFFASPEGRTGISSYKGEGCHLGGIIGIPWPGTEAGLGVHVATICSFFVVFARCGSCCGWSSRGVCWRCSPRTGGRVGGVPIRGGPSALHGFVTGPQSPVILEIPVRWFL